MTRETYREAEALMVQIDELENYIDTMPTAEYGLQEVRIQWAFNDITITGADAMAVFGFLREKFSREAGKLEEQLEKL